MTDNPCGEQYGIGDCDESIEHCRLDGRICSLVYSSSCDRMEGEDDE